MRSLLVLFYVLVGFVSLSQVGDLPADSNVLFEDSVERISNFDGQTPFTYSTLSDSAVSQSRVAVFQSKILNKDSYFFIILGFSLLLTLIYLNSKDMVRNTITSLSSLHNTIQFSRTEKQRNGFYFVLYLIMSVLGIALTGQYILTNIYGLNYSPLSFTVFVVFVILLDYLSNYLYFLFTTNSKSVDMVQTVFLSFSVLLSFIIWPLLFFVILSSLATAKVFFIILAVTSGLIFILKELRTLQILWLEKIDIFSFNFFAYLCTFKFLPLFVVMKVFF